MIARARNEAIRTVSDPPNIAFDFLALKLKSPKLQPPLKAAFGNSPPFAHVKHCSPLGIAPACMSLALPIMSGARF